MSSWYSAWLPGLPSLNFAIPSGLQGRFVSFLLKKCLGHFLKPGQLDVRQIESQIGSGFVQVNDLELDNEAINSTLAGLPLELRDGYISSVTARVPWPNPLTSTIGLTLDSMHLTFSITPGSNPVQSPDLADSVASVAETFVQEELLEQENAELLGSISAEVVQDTDSDIPGGLDPFVPKPEDAAHGEFEPVGVSLFSTLIEKLLARFEFNALNTKITLVHPGNMSITLSIAEVCYRTEVDGQGSATSEQSVIEGEKRTLTISGVLVTSRNLRPSTLPYYTSNPRDHRSPSKSSSPNLTPVTASVVDVVPASPSTSVSSIDEETQAIMAQSLVSLPPRPDSLTGSFTSSLYQSAISEGFSVGSSIKPPDDSAHATRSTVDLETGVLVVSSSDHDVVEGKDIVILSLGCTPIVIRMATSDLFKGGTSDGSIWKQTSRPSIQLSATMGFIPLAIYAWQIAGIMKLADCFSRHASQGHSPQSVKQIKKMSSTTSLGALKWVFDLQVNGLIVLILPTPTPFSDHGVALSEFYDDPSLPPRLPQGFVRIHVGSITMAAATSSYPPSASQNQPPRSDANDTLTMTGIKASIAIADFMIYSHTSPNERSEFTITPVCFTDPHLSGQYTVPAFQYRGPEDPVVHPETPKFPLARKREAPGSELSLNGEDAIAITVEITSTIHGKQEQKMDVVISAIPFNIVVDMRDLLGNEHAQAFMDTLAQATNEEIADNRGVKKVEEDVLPHGVHDASAGDTPPATPHAHYSPEQERRRLERLVMEDLELDLDYQPVKRKKSAVKVSSTCNHVHFIIQATSKRDTKQVPQTNITVTFAMIRFQLRCSPLPLKQPRSGTLVIDLNNLQLRTGASSRHQSTRFTSNASLTKDMSHLVPLANAQCSNILVAYSPTEGSLATTIVLFGSLFDKDPASPKHPQTGNPSLQPHLTVSTSTLSHDHVPTTVVDLNIPSTYLILSKDIFDGLLFWADDLTRLTPSDPPSDTDKGSRNRSPSAASSISENGNGSTQEGKCLLIRSTISDATVRLMIPRSDESGAIVRPFDMTASDLDVSLEVKSGDKGQSVVNVDIMQLAIINWTSTSEKQVMLKHACPRNLSSHLKPTLDLCFVSSSLPRGGKETDIQVTLWGIMCNVYSDIQWTRDLSLFVKSPPGVFESVIPSERTSISIKAQDSSIRIFAPNYPGAILTHMGDLEFATEIIGGATESVFRLLIPNISFLAVDDALTCENIPIAPGAWGVTYWRNSGYALVIDITDLDLSVKNNTLVEISETWVGVERVNLKLHLCADTMIAVSSFIEDWQHTLHPQEIKHNSKSHKEPAVISDLGSSRSNLMSSVDDFAFQRPPEIGPAPDLINDDLPTNLDYLDESFSAAAGLRELCDEDLNDFNSEEDFEVDLNSSSVKVNSTGIISRVGGETIKMLRPEGIQIIEDYFDSLTPETTDGTTSFGDTTLRVRIYNSNVTLLLYDGYDWVRTRKTIEKEVKDMRRRLAKLRQLVASGQTQESDLEGANTLLFNSVYIGLEQDSDALEPGALIAAIDEELNDDHETASQSSWQSLRPPIPGKPRPRSIRVHGKRLTRSRGPSMEFLLQSLKAEVDHYRPPNALVSRTFCTVKDVEILDHIKTSTWKKFLTSLQYDSHGNTRETDSSMVRVELRNVRPVPGHPSEEVRLRAKILPLRLYVDQDAVDFLKKFFSFKDPHATPKVEDSSSEETYIQLAEVFPVDLKLDYKPRRVDYKALREGRTIELMNFFHFDGAEMTLRHIRLAGVTGWARMFELLNDLWTPDVKATQLVDVISGVAPIRSVVNVGSGVADLVLLPISQYKKDGRILRGFQKGTTAFFKSTALEAIKLGAKLATGTQVILEQAEGVLGGQFQHPVTAEPLQIVGEDMDQMAYEVSEDEGTSEIISKYADQPMDIQEGFHSAYKSLQRNFSSAAQTILAVPMEVYERSGDEKGAVRSVIRAVPIAVLKPMIGATEAVSKTLLGLHNTLDSNVRHDNEAKYKNR
ncbi:hypothetical protein AMATHDRAFT_38236 [Amanita thiersii Skay4041]|uniref:Autophagy-related protein 2 n=1 Tax=Amanita thiersii Skay4041 TaxID=703135 RepID=A0A2A9NTI6_9AGAR|nr:hypothetical protein AMATHDRAFT_38236 [Amanita thiersii Skay4041]